MCPSFSTRDEEVTPHHQMVLTCRVGDDSFVGSHYRRCEFSGRCDNDPVSRVFVKVAGKEDQLDTDFPIHGYELETFDQIRLIQPVRHVPVERQPAFVDQHGNFPGRDGRYQTRIVPLVLRSFSMAVRAGAESRFEPFTHQINAWVSSNIIARLPSHLRPRVPWVVRNAVRIRATVRADLSALSCKVGSPRRGDRDR